MHEGTLQICRYMQNIRTCCEQSCLQRVLSDGSVVSSSQESLIYRRKGLYQIFTGGRGRGGRGGEPRGEGGAGEGRGKTKATQQQLTFPFIFPIP